MDTRVVDLIVKKRDGLELTGGEIASLIGGYTAGEVPESQMSAWAMAVFFRGLSMAETSALTRAMLASGETLRWEEGPPLVDKHSTGGVGDKTSLVLAPLAASLGLRVPMLAGRALGITGGTLDKCDAMPGYRTQLATDEFVRIVRDVGFAIAGQSAALCPADRLLYALRDVTGTVESVPLVTASILSKKAAEGAQALVCDVKAFSGAFMRTLPEARALAASLETVGQALGLRIRCVVSDMDEPLGNAVGNFLEVEECLDCLEGKGPADLVTLNEELGARMAMLGGLSKTLNEGIALCREALAGGRPRELFLKNVEAQGGDVKKLLALRGRFRAPFEARVCTPRGGYVMRVDAGLVGRAAHLLGAGRAVQSDTVSAAAGLRLHAKRGAPAREGEPLATLWAETRERLAAALPVAAAAFAIGDAPPAAKPVIVST
ncbi:MAG: thymidine phosphorylase [Treponema sp.]|jgi:pyrimidine-nucleoside phosphorylase|nr:thymidine phosphorylase [Treponema sp.]